MRGDSTSQKKDNRDNAFYKHCSYLEISDENAQLLEEYISNQNTDLDEILLSKFHPQQKNQKDYMFRWRLLQMISEQTSIKVFTALCKIFTKKVILDDITSYNTYVQTAWNGDNNDISDSDKIVDAIGYENFVVCILRNIISTGFTQEYNVLEKVPEHTAIDVYEYIKCSYPELLPCLQCVLLTNEPMAKKYNLVSAFEDTIRANFDDKNDFAIIECFHPETDLITDQMLYTLNYSNFAVKFSFFCKYACRNYIGISPLIDKIIYICLLSDYDLVNINNVFNVPMENLARFFEKSPINFLNLVLNQSLDFLEFVKKHKYIKKEEIQHDVLEHTPLRALSDFISGKIDLCDVASIPKIDYDTYNECIHATKKYSALIGKDKLHKRMIIASVLMLEDINRYDDGTYMSGITSLNAYGCPVQFMDDKLTLLFTRYFFSDMLQQDSKGEETIFGILVKDLSTHADYMKNSIAQYATYSVNKRFAIVRAMSYHLDLYQDNFVNMTENSKVVNALITKIYIEHPELVKQQIPRLTSSVLAVRKNAFQLLKAVDAEQYREHIQAVYDTEKNAKLKIEMEQFLHPEHVTPDQTTTNQDISVKRFTSGNKKQKVEFLYRNELPEVHFADGTLADELYMRACLISYTSDVAHATATLTQPLNQLELNHYSIQVFHNYLEDGAVAKQRWVLYFCSIYGGYDMVELLKRNIKTWAENSRGAIAGEATKALSLNPAPIALMTVDAMSRKYKFKQVKNAAIEALEFAAKELNITKEQLADRIVPNLGFDESMKLVFDYGTRKFDVFLNTGLELEVFDENNKKLKSLPAVSKKDDEELGAASLKQFKDLKKQLKLTVSTQRDRLEMALSDGRQWTKESFETLFVKNPIMHNFAIGLIWGTYDNAELVSTFRYMEDGSFNDENEDEFTLPDGAIIGIAHPIEMTEDSIAIWKEQLDDYEVIQPLVQLEREVYLPTEEELTSTQCKRFGGKILSPSTLSTKLLALNFSRGDALDGGWFDEFNKINQEYDIAVVVNFSGASISYYDGMDPATMHDIRFYSTKNLAARSVYHDKCDYLPIGAIAAKLFSETINQITKATITSTETDSDWENNKQY